MDRTQPRSPATAALVHPLSRTDPHWLGLKRLARARGRGLCEFCRLRPPRALHHRVYARRGRERPEDVMLVCDPCHRWVHRLRLRVLAAPGSLAASGDSGVGVNGPWLDYLAAAPKT